MVFWFNSTYSNVEEGLVERAHLKVEPLVNDSTGLEVTRIQLGAAMLGRHVGGDCTALIEQKVTLLVQGDIVVGVHLEVLGCLGVTLEGDSLNDLVGHLQGFQCQIDIPGNNRKYKIEVNI